MITILMVPNILNASVSVFQKSYSSKSATGQMYNSLNRNSCGKASSSNLLFSSPPPRVRNTRPVDITQPSQSTTAVTIDIVAHGTRSVASRTDIVHLFVPAGILKIPPSLLDPEVTDLTANNGVPVFFGAGSVGQTMIAQSEL